jgi:predicted MFS family arabinose efflux permease
VAAVALGIFTVMTAELLPVGLLSPMAAELAVSEGTAGLLVTVPGLVAAIAALVIVARVRLDRRVLLVALVALAAAANLAGAWAPTIEAMLASRVAVGVAIGGFWAIAGSLAIRLVPARHVGGATTVIFAGVSAAVLGIPAATTIGEAAGWRAAFAATGGLGAAAGLAVALLLPALTAPPAVPVVRLPALLKADPVGRVGALLTALLVTAHFAGYTYLRPVLAEAGIGGQDLAVLLLAFGAAGVLGNVLAGSQAPRHPRGTLGAIALGIAAAAGLLATLGAGPGGTAALLVLWGAAYGGVSVGLQIWMMRTSHSPEAATSLFVAAFNAAIALGALLGGQAADHLGVWAAPALGAVLAVLAAAALRASTAARALSTTAPR